MATKAYPGSCHCGDVQYQVRLTLPPTSTIGHDAPREGTRIYRCNCSTCHKMGMLHCRPDNLVQDFILTSPSDPKDLGEYRCFREMVGWHFCKRCGVRTFGVIGNWVSEDVDVAKWAAGSEAEGVGSLQKVWKTVPLTSGEKGHGGAPMHYVSVNGTTLEEIDLVDVQKKGWIYYVNSKEMKEGEWPEMRFKEPYKGGCY